MKKIERINISSISLWTERWFLSNSAKNRSNILLIFALFLGLIGTAFSVLIRLELSGPGVQYIADNQLYNSLIIIAWVIIIFLMVLPGLIGLTIMFLMFFKNIINWIKNSLLLILFLSFIIQIISSIILIECYYIYLYNFDLTLIYSATTLSSFTLLPIVFTRSFSSTSVKQDPFTGTATLAAFNSTWTPFYMHASIPLLMGTCALVYGMLRVIDLIPNDWGGDPEIFTDIMNAIMQINVNITRLIDRVNSELIVRGNLNDRAYGYCLVYVEHANTIFLNFIEPAMVRLESLLANAHNILTPEQLASVRAHLDMLLAKTTELRNTLERLEELSSRINSMVNNIEDHNYRTFLLSLPL